MNPNPAPARTSRITWTLAGAAAGFAAALLVARGPGVAAPARAAEASAPAKNEAQAGPAKSDLDALRELLPEQSSAMADVAFHFSNLWFAGRAENWPLAEFYLSETRAHLKWAVRLKPFRKDPEGRDLDMAAILAPIDESMLAPLAADVKAHDRPKFEDAYRLMLERGCYACHKTVGKPYLRPQIPERPPQEIINFDPNAKWPE